MPSVDLVTPLTLRNAFRFPLQSRAAQREVLIGAALLLVPVIGWLLNMGHRVRMVHNLQHGQPAWPAWRDVPALLKHGAITFLGMIYYALPGGLAIIGGLALDTRWLIGVGAVLLIGAVIAICGYMSHYCVAFDPAEIYNPVRALSRVAQGGGAYWRAWGIALCALTLSFLGLLALGVGFLVASVWFWQVAGFSFATVFSQRFGLSDKLDPATALAPEPR